MMPLGASLRTGSDFLHLSCPIFARQCRGIASTIARVRTVGRYQGRAVPGGKNRRQPCPDRLRGVVSPARSAASSFPNGSAFLSACLLGSPTDRSFTSATGGPIGALLRRPFGLIGRVALPSVHCKPTSASFAHGP